MTISDDHAALWALISAQEFHSALERFLHLPEQEAPASLMVYGYILCGLRRYDEALGVFQQLQRVWQGGPQEHMAVHQQGMVERERQNYAAALRLYEQERSMIHHLDLTETPSPPKAMRYAVNGYELGVNHLHLGHLPAAKRALTEALQQAQQAGDAMTLGCVHRAWGDYQTVADEPTKARTSYQEAQRYFQQAADAKAMQDVQQKLNALMEQQA